MQLKNWWSSTGKFFSNNAIYLFHAYLFTFIAAMATVWLVLRGSMAKEAIFTLNLIIVIFVYAAFFSLFIFILEYLFQIKKIKKNAFQQKLIFYLFAVVNVFLALFVRFLIFSFASPAITELEMKLRFQESLEGVNVTGYHYFNSTYYDVWARTNQKIELELSRIKNNHFYTNEPFYVRRIGSVQFFTHNCHNDLDIGNKKLASLLLGKEIESPSELINTFSQSTSSEVTQRLKYFQEFDSVTLEGVAHACNRISVNDFHTRKHAYGPAYVSYLNDSLATIEFTETGAWNLVIFDVKTLKTIASYQTTKGRPEVHKSTINENVFIVNSAERTVTSLHTGSGQVLTYNIPSNVLFYTVGLVSRSGYLLMNFEGQPTLIGPRFSRSRQTTILDRLTSL